MDFAEASHYWLSVATGIHEILTVDMIDFGWHRPRRPEI
jgi:hypothetical protein